MSKTLLSVASLREEYGFGRDLASLLVKLLPSVRIGHSGRGERLLVRRTDIERLIEKAIKERRTLWDIARNSTPATLEAWLQADRT